jgi:hypothetical protein
MCVPMIEGPTPVHLFMAPKSGTGKTLLVQCMAAVALGRKELETMTADAEEPEIRKAAIQALNGKEVDGRSLTVNEAKPKTEGGGGRSGSGGRGGYGGGGGGRRY